MYSIETYGTELLRIKVLNTNKLIPAVNQLAVSIAGLYDFPDELSTKIQLVIEETALNIIENSFDKDESGYYYIIFEKTPNVLIIAFEDQGLPYELSKFEKHEDSNLRLVLMKAVADEIHFINLGKNGKRIEIHINIPYKEINEFSLLGTKQFSPDEPKDLRPVQLTMMQPNMSIGLSACVYRTYGYTYLSDYIYYPEKIAELINSGLLHSCIAVNEDGEIVAHLGLNFPTADSKVGETGQAVVDPRYRGRGLFEQMKKYLAEHEKKRGSYGFYSESVSIHPYTQKGNISLGAVETGILLGYIPESLFFKKIHESSQSQRQSAILYYMKLNEEPERTLYAGTEYNQIVKKICNGLNLNRNVVANFENINHLNTHSLINMVIKPEWSQAYLVVRMYGDDFMMVLRNKFLEIKLRKIDCIYIDLPLSDNLTTKYIPQINELGFFFAGVIPELMNGDILRLQYLNNFMVEPEKIVTVSDFGKELLDFTLNDKLNIQSYNEV
ncbi:MAG: GNAT family N-acetyltransferase [Candidatus Kapaibacterium sp.]|jgi:serine/threonine-protein kinase RsbW|nr:GNAT family N-acetyltransferase [Candidatus Kapabacteria bacterium]